VGAGVCIWVRVCMCACMYVGVGVGVWVWVRVYGCLTGGGGRRVGGWEGGEGGGWNDSMSRLPNCVVRHDNIVHRFIKLL